MGGRAASDLLALPVRLHGIQLGKPIEGLIDAVEDRLLGFEIACGDGARRFLPLSVAEIGADAIGVASALQLLDERELQWYARHARRLSELGYADPWVAEDGAIRETLSAA